MKTYGRQGETVDTLLKLLDEEAIAETCGNEDGTYRAIVFTTEEVRSFFAYYHEVQDRNDVLPSSSKLILKSWRSIRKINPYNHTIPRKT